MADLRQVQAELWEKCIERPNWKVLRDAKGEVDERIALLESQEVVEKELLRRMEGDQALHLKQMV